MTATDAALPMGPAQYVDVAGRRTRYFEAGSGEPVILVGGGHFGSPYAATDWDLNFNALAQHFRVIALDKLGQGHTDNPERPEEYLIGSAVQHVRDFVTTLGITNASFVGHSRGGYAVCRIAMEAPELVRALVVVDSGTLMHSHSAFYPELAAKMAQIPDVRERYEFSIREQSYAESMATEFWLEDVLSFSTSPKCVESARLAEQCAEQFSRDLVERQHETREWIRGGGLGDTPVLLIWAYNDRGAPIDECGVPAMHLFLSSTPNSRMHVFNRSGHFPFREWPAEFNRLVGAFLADATATAHRR